MLSFITGVRNFIGSLSCNCCTTSWAPAVVPIATNNNANHFCLLINTINIIISVTQRQAFLLTKRMAFLLFSDHHFRESPVRSRKTKKGCRTTSDNPPCGKTGIRTLGTVTRSPHFECGPIDHSGIFPFPSKNVAKIMFFSFNSTTYPNIFLNESLHVHLAAEGFI